MSENQRNVFLCTISNSLFLIDFLGKIKINAVQMKLSVIIWFNILKCEPWKNLKI